MKIYGFDIGGTSVKYSVYDKKLKTLNCGKFESQNDGHKILDEIVEILKKDKNIDAVGISSAGVIDFDTGVVLSSANIENYTGINVIDYIQKSINVPVIIDNDVNCAAYAELMLGNLKNTQNSLMLTIGTGIGGSIIMNGKIYRGSNYAAGEIGHHFINDRTYEENASTKNVLLKAKEYNITSTFELLEADSEIKNTLLKQMYQSIGIGIYNIVTILDLTHVVIGGGIVQNENFKIDEIHKYSHFGQIKVVNPKLSLKKAAFSNNSGSLGAALLAKSLIE
jgi:predicted NBD/HSP70 family sugar kinase